MFSSYIIIWSTIYAIQMLIAVNMTCPLRRGKLSLFHIFVMQWMTYMFVIPFFLHRELGWTIIVGGLLETICYVFTVFCVTKGSLYYNVFVSILVLKLGSFVWGIFASLIPPVKQVLMESMIGADSPDSIFYTILGAGFLFLLTLLCGVIYRLLQPTGSEEYVGSDRIFLFGYIVLCIFMAVSQMIRYKAQNVSIVVAAAFLFPIIVLQLLSYAYNKLERKRIEKEQQKLREHLSDIYQSYELAVRENKELKDIKHDMNKQLEVIRQLAQQEERSEVRKYLLQMTSSETGYGNLPLSGNQDVDAILAMLYLQTKKKSIMLETVVEPLDDLPLDQTELIVLLTSVSDEVMEKCTAGTATPWIRFSIRRKGKNILFMVEYSMHKKFYAFKKVLSGLFLLELGYLKANGLVKDIVQKHQGIHITGADEEHGFISIMI